MGPQQGFPLAAPYQLGGRGRIPGMDVENLQNQQAQNQLSNILYQQALGGGPSAAQPLLQGAMEQGLRQQMTLAAAGGPSGLSGGLRGAQLATPEMTAQFGREAAQLRAQEQQAAQGLLGQNLGTTRGQDLQAQLGAAGLLDTGANQDLQAFLGTANLGMGFGGQELARAGLGLSADQAQAQQILAALGLQQGGIQGINQLIAGQQAANAGYQQQHAQGVQGAIVGGLSGAGALGWQPFAPSAPGGAQAPVVAPPMAGVYGNPNTGTF
jgi:hypothetical protein